MIASPNSTACAQPASSPTPVVSRNVPGSMRSPSATGISDPAKRTKCPISRVGPRHVPPRARQGFFLTIRDGWDDLQLYSNVDTLGQESFDS